MMLNKFIYGYEYQRFEVMYTLSITLLKVGIRILPQSFYQGYRTNAFPSAICIQQHGLNILQQSANQSFPLSSIFCCRAGSGYPNGYPDGYPVSGNSRGGFPLPSSRFMITYCDQSFPSLWHCLCAAPSLSGANLLSNLEGVPLSATWGYRWSP